VKRNYYLLILTILFCSCSSITLREGLNISEKDDWLEAGRDEAKTNVSNPNYTLNPPFENVWKFNAEAAFCRNAFVVSDGVLFASSLNGIVYAVNMKNGSGLGKANTKSKSSFSCPLIMKNNLMFIFSDGEINNITNYDFISGEFKWQKNTEKVMSSPVAKDEFAFYSTTKGNIYEMNSESGEQIRKYKNDSSFFTSPSICNDMLLIGDAGGKLVAFDINSGDLKWSYKTGGGIYSDVSIWKGKIYFASDDKNFYCLDTGGNLVWKKYLDTKFLSSSTFYNENVICAGVNGKIYSLNMNTGDINWQYETKGTITASPVLNNNKIFIGSYDTFFYCIDANKGEVLWKYQFDERIRTTAVIWKNYIVVANDDKSIYCFK
jgi:eukaryotic-like serine/threonine-protein kinase